MKRYILFLFLVLSGNVKKNKKTMNVMSLQLHRKYWYSKLNMSSFNLKLTMYNECIMNICTMNNNCSTITKSWLNPEWVSYIRIIYIRSIYKGIFLYLFMAYFIINILNIFLYFLLNFNFYFEENILKIYMCSSINNFL